MLDDNDLDPSKAVDANALEASRLTLELYEWVKDNENKGTEIQIITLALMSMTRVMMQYVAANDPEGLKWCKGVALDIDNLFK